MNNQPFRSLSTQTGSSLTMMMPWISTPQNQTCRAKSRSFLHRINDRLRKIWDQSSKDAMQDSNEHSFFKWRMFMCSILEATVFMGKNYSENLLSIKKITVNNLTIVISLSHVKVYVLSDSELRFGKINQHPTTNSACEEKFTWFQDFGRSSDMNQKRSGVLLMVADHKENGTMWLDL